MVRPPDALIPTPALRGWVHDLFRAAGASAIEAERTADHLVEANLTGHDSHGVGMAPRYIAALLAGELRLGESLETVVDAGSMLVVDGRQGLGQSSSPAPNICVNASARVFFSASLRRASGCRGR